jgi:hypothetical protein
LTLQDQNKVLQTQIQTQQIQLQIVTQKIIELETKLNLNSKNSSMPPSSDHWKRPQTKHQKTDKKPGAQPRHKGHGLKITRPPDKHITLKPKTCTNCHTDLTTTQSTPTDIRYKIDLQINSTLTKYTQQTTICPTCQTQNLAPFPENLNSTIQYGEGIQTLCVLLTNYANVSYDKTQKILTDVFGIPLSSGTIVNQVEAFAQKTQPYLTEIKTHLINAEVVDFDETGAQVEGKTQWIHNASNTQATYLTIHSKRGQAGIDDNGVLTNFRGVAVHDCWKPYFTYEGCLHALCNGHLLRELLGVEENTAQRWACLMADLLRRFKWFVDQYKEFGLEMLPVECREEFVEEFLAIVGLGELENPLVAGVRKRSKARCLLDRFLVYRGEICRFASDFRVPFDNNLAERDIRGSKVKLKVSGCFRSTLGARNFCYITSIVGTAIKQKKSVFNTICDIIAGTTPTLLQNNPD